MENAHRELGPDAAKKVNLVFITIDPERDYGRAAQGLRNQFGPTFIGLTARRSRSPTPRAPIASTSRR